ncbi:hypothetical protein [Bradyrhizobium sp. Rc3b]|uniref:hypothetical protein n=1 Tax=Bradyrhizobium sp. Rc3b TaxID=1855322 RepID=UPI0015A6B49F
MPGLIGSAVATGSVDKARLDIRQADNIRTAIGAQRYVMAAMAVEHNALQAISRILPNVIFTGRPSACVGVGVGVWCRAEPGMPLSKRAASRSRVINYLGFGMRPS